MIMTIITVVTTITAVTITIIIVTITVVLIMMTIVIIIAITTMKTSSYIMIKINDTHHGDKDNIQNSHNEK